MFFRLSQWGSGRRLIDSIFSSLFLCYCSALEMRSIVFCDIRWCDCYNYITIRVYSNEGPFVMSYPVGEIAKFQKNSSKISVFVTAIECCCIVL